MKISNQALSRLIVGSPIGCPNSHLNVETSISGDYDVPFYVAVVYHSETILSIAYRTKGFHLTVFIWCNSQWSIWCGI